MTDARSWFARYRVRLGFALAALVFWLARPSWWSLVIGTRGGGSGRGDQNLGRRASGEGARGHRFGSVSIYAAPPVPGIRCRRVRLRDCVGERHGCDPRGRLPCRDDFVSNSQRGAASHREVRFRISLVSRRPGPCGRPSVQLSACDGQPRIPCGRRLGRRACASGVEGPIIDAGLSSPASSRSFNGCEA